MYSPVVTLRVGPERRDFLVHRALLCGDSKYFKKAFKGSFEEARTSISVLKDVDFKLVKVFVGWLYNSHLSYVTDDSGGFIEEDFSEYINYELNDDNDDDDDDNKSVKGCDDLDKSSSDTKSRSSEGDTSSSTVDSTEAVPDEREESCSVDEIDGNIPETWPYMILFKLSVFADRFEVLQLQNDIIDVLGTRLSRDNLPTADSIKYVYSNTTRGSALRRLVTDNIAYCSKSQSFSYWESMPKDLLAEITRISLARLPHQQCEDCFKSALKQTDIEEEKIPQVSEQGDLPAYEYDMCIYHEHKDDSERDMCRKHREQRKDT